MFSDEQLRQADTKDLLSALARVNTEIERRGRRQPTFDEIVAHAGVPHPGAHPVTGRPFVDGDIENTSERQCFRVLRPAPPTRQTCDYIDDDGVEVNPRQMTDAEYANAIAAYELADSEWRKSGGTVVSAGPSVTRGRFRCADGAEVEAVLGPDGWHWLAW